MNLIFAVIDWPDAALGIVIVGTIALAFGVLERFTVSKESGVSFERTKADAEFVFNLTEDIDRIDNACRLSCWRTVLDNKPLFLTLQQQQQVMLQVLEAVSFNHMLRQIALHGYPAYVKLKQNMISKPFDNTVNKKVLDKWVENLISQLFHYAKTSAAEKLDKYRQYTKKPNMSESNKLVLQDRIDKNTLYLSLTRTSVPT